MNWNREKTKLVTNIVLGIVALLVLLQISQCTPEKVQAEGDMSPAMFEVVETRKMFGNEFNTMEVKLLHEIGTDALWLYAWGGMGNGGPALAPYETGWWCSKCESVLYKRTDIDPRHHRNTCRGE